MRIDITINKKAVEEIKRLAQYRLFKLKIDGRFNNRLHSRLNYSSRFIELEEEILTKLLELIENLERDKELIL